MSRGNDRSDNTASGVDTDRDPPLTSASSELECGSFESGPQSPSAFRHRLSQGDDDGDEDGDDENMSALAGHLVRPTPVDGNNAELAKKMAAAVNKLDDMGKAVARFHADDRRKARSTHRRRQASQTTTTSIKRAGRSDSRPGGTLQRGGDLAGRKLIYATGRPGACALAG